MSRKLDYSHIWATTTAQLSAHREGIGAIAGLFLFLPDWISRLFAGPLDLQSGLTGAEMVALLSEYLANHWPVLIPTGLLNLYGAVAIYTLLVRKDAPTIGATLGKALALLPVYFLIHVAGAFLTFLGLIALILPGIYIAGRLTTLGPVAVAEAERGFSGVFSRAWALTRDNGWSVFFLTLVVGLLANLTGAILVMAVGLIVRLLLGSAGLPLIETGVAAAVSAAVAALLIALSVAIYRALSDEQ